MPSRQRETAVSMPLTPSRSDLYWRRIFEKVKYLHNNIIHNSATQTGAKTSYCCIHYLHLYVIVSKFLLVTKIIFSFKNYHKNYEQIRTFYFIVNMMQTYAICCYAGSY